jgi:glutathione S-transferase
MHDVTILRYILRYFPIVGRAQALRHVLADAGVAFTDLRVTQEEWSEAREDPFSGGPFAGLPTLSVGKTTVGETLAIAAFLGRHLGHYEGLDPAAVARLEAVTSCCYLEVLLRMNEVLWAEHLYPGTDLPNAFARHLARMLDKLGRLDRITPAEGWFTPHRPGCADFFAAEAVEALRHVLGPARDPALANRLPRLVALADRVRRRPAIRKAWESRPEVFSTKPDEAELLERLRGL